VVARAQSSVGGLLAAASLALTGLVNWTISQIDTLADPALAAR
jgi:hypothetical protein